MHLQQLGVVGGGVHVHEYARVLHLYLRHGYAAALERALQSALARVSQHPVYHLGGHQYRVAGLTPAHRAGQRCAAGQERAHRRRREQRHVHRGEQHHVALALQVLKAYLRRVEHLRAGVVLVAQEYDPALGQVPLQLLRVVAGDHDHLLRPGLAQSRRHSLRYRDSTYAQHGLELAHSRRHTRRGYDSSYFQVCTSCSHPSPAPERRVGFVQFDR